MTWEIFFKTEWILKGVTCSVEEVGKMEIKTFVL